MLYGEQHYLKFKQLKRVSEAIDIYTACSLIVMTAVFLWVCLPWRWGLLSTNHIVFISMMA